MKPWGFYGRQRELADLRAILERGRWSFVQASGRGRIGKTSLTFTAEEKLGGVMATFVRQVSQSDSPSRSQSRSQSGRVAEGVTEGVSGGVNGGLTGGVSEPADLLALIEARPGLKAGALVALTGQLQRTIERRLQRLKASGQIEFHGVPKTGGYHATR